MPVYAGQLQAIAQNQSPRPNATAALIMDLPTGRVVYGQNIHQRLAPASTTKIMTAIVALEKGHLTDKVKVEAKNLVGESTMGLVAGDVLTLEDLLWGMLLPSGNDAANVIAAYVGGTVDNFVQMMNDKAKELGLQDTQFKNPHGLDEDGHYSSAYDLAIMGRYAMRNPTFAKISGTYSYTINASRTYYLINSNQLLKMKDTVPGADGIKTGTTGNAGDCIVASINRDNHRIIAVVMGTPSRIPEITKVIDYAYRSFSWVPLALPPAASVVGDDGQQYQLDLGVQREEMVPSWQRYYLTPAVTVDRPALGQEGNPQVGRARYRLGDSSLVTLPVFVHP